MLRNLNDNNAEPIDCSQQSSNETIAEISADLSQMRSRVDKELEKIETWKAIADQNIKKRDEKIECLIVESNDLKRKLILIENEKKLLSDKFNKERDERIKINIEINNSSEALTRIKNNISDIEQRFKTLEEIEKLIKQLNDTRCEQFEHISKNLNNMEIRYQTNITIITQKISEKQTELFLIKEKLTESIQEYDLQLKESNEELSNLKETIFRSNNESIFDINELNYNLNKANEQNVLMENELNALINLLNNQLIIKTVECDDFRLGFDELLRNFNDLKFTYEINTSCAEKNCIEIITDMLIRETNVNELNNYCNDLRIQNTELSKQLLEHQLNIETIKQNIHNEIETTKNKMKLNIDLILADKVNVENNQQIVKRKFEARVTELENLVKEKNQSIDELNKNITVLKAQLNNLKLVLIAREKNKMQAFYENEKLRSDYEIVRNANQCCVENLAETKNEIKNLNKKISMLFSDLEITKQSKTNVKLKLKREKHEMESVLSNQRQMIESCKFDYKQRMEQTESRVYNLTKNVENLAKHITLAYQTNKKLKAEKIILSQKLQELQYSICQLETQTPINVILNENLYEIENMSCDTLSPTKSCLIVLSESQLIEIVSKIVSQLSGKENCEQIFGSKRKYCSESEQFLLNEKLKKIKIYENIDNSVYEILNNKELGEEKYSKRETSEYMKYSFKQSDRTTTELNVESKRTLYNIEKVEFDTHFIANKIRLQSRAKTRFENILFGRTTNQNSDLSWLHL